MRTMTIAFTTIMLALFSSYAVAQNEFGFALCNVDGLYDTIPSPFYNDTDYTPEGRLGWNRERYERKVRQVAAVLDSLAMPVVVLSGVENEDVVRDVVLNCKNDYSYIHRTLGSFDGLDFALLYFGDLLVPQHIDSDRRSMVVEARVGNSDFAFILCNRARNIDDIVERVRDKEPDVHVVVAGDLRDTGFERFGFRDATAAAESAGRGNALYRNGWRMFDRVAVDDSLEAVCEVYGRRWLLDRKGAPAATFEGRLYKGGLGRRLPIYGRIRVNKRK